MLESLLLDSAAVSWLAFGPANTFQPTLAKISRSKAARWFRFIFAIIRLLCSETGRDLKKQGICIPLAMRVVPFIGGFQNRARAEPIIESESPAFFLRRAEPARSATEMIPAED